MSPDDSRTSIDDRYSPEERREDVFAFLAEKGAVELLCEVDQGEEDRFTDLAERVPVSSSTLSKRLEEAVDCEILSIHIARSEYGTQKQYRFTHRGRYIQRRMQTQGLMRVYREYRAYQKEFNSQKDALKEWTEEEYYEILLDVEEFVKNGGDPSHWKSNN